MFGIATYRAGNLSHWAALLIIIGPVINYIGVMAPMISTIGALLTNIAIAWLSYDLVTGTTEQAVAVPEAQPAM